MNLDKLKEPFAHDVIHWRVGATNKEKTKGIPFAYIDARDVQDRLDDVCGIGGWQALCPHANGKTSYKIGIKVGDEWVWKENGAGDSDVEAEKGAFSDALKRAAVMWGIGRYLYDVKNIWVDIEPNGKSHKIKDRDDPRLKKILLDAEKGIRAAPEPEPIPKETLKVQPFSDDEANMLIDRIRKAPELMDLNGEKANARAAWPRMSKKHQDLITAEIKKREDFVVQIPLAAE